MVKDINPQIHSHFLSANVSNGGFIFLHWLCFVTDELLPRPNVRSHIVMENGN